MSETTLQIDRPEALISTPAEVAVCTDALAHPGCDDYVIGIRNPGDEPGTTFAHCPVCGNTNLFDTRSPFQVLAEARANLAAVTGDDVASAYRRMDRQDVVARVEAIARLGDPSHCSDCEHHALRSGL